MQFKNSFLMGTDMTMQETVWAFSPASVGREHVSMPRPSELSLVKQQLCKTYSQHVRFLFTTDDEV